MVFGHNEDVFALENRTRRQAVGNFYRQEKHLFRMIMVSIDNAAVWCAAFYIYYNRGNRKRQVLRNMKKPENFCWQEGECCGILLKLSLRGAAVKLKSGLKRTKKVLDKRISVWYNKQAVSKETAIRKVWVLRELLQKPRKKVLKKFLTNETSSDIINKLRMRSWAS